MAEREYQKGLPPRGRGRGMARGGSRYIERITPAWAGKSPSGNALTWPTGDYPRVGGEELLRGFLATPRKGLPPRGRGRGSGNLKRGKPLGITPAWAGKSALLKRAKTHD